MTDNTPNPEAWSLSPSTSCLTGRAASLRAPNFAQDGYAASASFELVLNSDNFDDWTGLLDFLRTEFAYTCGVVQPPSTVFSMYVDDLACRARTEDLLLAFHAGELAGCLFLKSLPDTLFLGRFAISTALRGTGLARMMTEFAATIAAERGLGKLQLETRVALLENQKKFSRLGFYTTGGRCHDGYSEITTLVMTRAITTFPSGRPE